MVFSFIHFADAHLGYQQYGLEERIGDYLHGLQDAIDYAIENKVNAILCAGDLFDKHSPPADTLYQTICLLQRVKDAGIKFIVIEGNHDKPLVPRQFSFLQLLHELGYLTLLKPRFANGKPVIDENSCLELGPVRVVGLGYHGSLVRSRLPIFAGEIQPSDKFTVAMLHAAFEGAISRAPAIVGSADLRPFKDRVDYFALGHIHQYYEKEGWIHNPGSLDYCDIDIDDAGEERKPKYFFHATIESKGVHIRRCETSARLAYYWVLDVHGVKGVDDVHRKVATLLSKKEVLVKHDMSLLPDRARRAPLIKLVIEGKIPFDKYAIDTEHIKTEVSKAFGCLHVKVENYASSPGMKPIRPQAVLDRAKIEREVFEKLATRELQRALGRAPTHKQIELVADLAGEFKTQAKVATPELNQRLLELIEERWVSK